MGSATRISVAGYEKSQSAPGTAAAGEVPAAPLTDGPDELGVPAVVLDAYRRAEQVLAPQPCRLSWTLLAAIGQVESHHAGGGKVDSAGNSRPVVGPLLLGTPGTSVLPDTDRGRLDGNTIWDRAVGPMQFIPATWQRYASDGNGDGKANPQNVYDAALAAGRYLCAGEIDLSSPEGLAAAIYRYNHSPDYVRTVLHWVAVYRSGGRAVDVPVADAAGTSAGDLSSASAKASRGSKERRPADARPAPGDRRDEPPREQPPQSGQPAPPQSPPPDSPPPQPDPCGGRPELLCRVPSLKDVPA